MAILFDEYLNALKVQQKSIERSLQGLPQEALEWKPGPEMNSLHVLAMHTAGSQRYWVGDVVAREPSGRVRAEEFRSVGQSAEALIAKLAETLAYSQRVVAGLTLPMLDETRLEPSSGEQVTVAGALLHALEHTALHAGHMEITRQLWEQRGRA